MSKEELLKLAEAEIARLGNLSCEVCEEPVKNYEKFDTRWGEECGDDELTGEVEIYKEVTCDENEVNEAEMAILAGRYHRSCDDRANNLHAFSLKTNDYNDAEELIHSLNNLTEAEMEDHLWYVGCPYEEYVYVGILG